MKEHLKLLGFTARDVITGTKGVVTSISFDLYGCVQAIVTPPVDKDGKQPDLRWFDTKRLTAVGDEPVMAVPCFTAPPGGQNLPAHPTQPAQ